MRHILDQLIAVLEQGQTAIMAAIVRSAGSTPRTSGARMLVMAGGGLSGSVGGGALEGKCLAMGKELLQKGGTHAELGFSLNALAAADSGMVCGGDADVLLQRVGPESLAMFQRLQADYRNGKRPVLLTFLPLKDLPPRFELFDPAEDGTHRELRKEILRKNRRAPFLIASGDREVFVEPLVHPGTVHLAGAGHVALACAQLAVFAGFEVVVIDDRADFASRERYPQAREVRVVEGFDRCLNGLGPDDYVVIVTRGHLHDRDVLAQALRTEAGYIGMIGSRSKRGAVYASLMKEGFTEKDLDRVHSPIGLTIGADTPEEIAVSIVAELIQARAGING
jgi:xanthine dehydrogenase accessory factor